MCLCSRRFAVGPASCRYSRLCVAISITGNRYNETKVVKKNRFSFSLEFINGSLYVIE